MSAHTPGPWVADKNGVVRAGPVRQYARGKGQGQLVAVGHLDLDDDELVSSMVARRDADTRLIAAAPELLEAAHKALAIHEDAACSCEGCLMLRAAIAKAEVTP